MKIMRPEPTGMKSSLPEGISIVVPVYRGMDTLDELVRALYVEIPRLNSHFEVILVDDGSHG